MAHYLTYAAHYLTHVAHYQTQNGQDKQMTQPNLPIISITPIMNDETHVTHYLAIAAEYLVL